jgi:uncharacterized membrane protein
MSGLWKGILIASLAVNFLFIGFVVGHQFGKEKTGTMAHLPGQNMRGEGMRGEGPQHKPALDNPMVLARMMVDTPILNDDDRAAVREAYKAYLPGIRRRAKEIEKARLETFLVLMEVPFDRTAYDSATERLRKLEGEQAEQVWAGIADGLVALPQERREKVQLYLQIKAQEEYAKRRAERRKRAQARRERLQQQEQPVSTPETQDKEPQK